MTVRDRHHRADVQAREYPMCPQRLLIVHPDASVRTLLISMLRTTGLRIDEAPNERSAVRMLDGQPVDLVLSAVGPRGAESDAEASEFLAYLRRKHPGVPVLLLSGDPRPERTREAIGRGASAVLRFPM